jgi:hypothetical protein|nr:MAG TPA: hypothetical protein [Caudoviricetes sp.]
MNPTKKPYQAATLTYESAIEPIADELYSKRVFEEGSRVFHAKGNDSTAEKLKRCAEDQDTRAWAFAEFVAKLFGLSHIDVRRDANERAAEMYMEGWNV